MRSQRNSTWNRKEQGSEGEKMSKVVKVVLIVSGAFLCLGCILFGIGLLFRNNSENGGLESLYCERTRRYHSNEW